MKSAKIIFVAVAVALVAGCASRPVPMLRPIESQLSLESAAHWNELAAQTATEVIATIRDGAAKSGDPVKVMEGELRRGASLYVNPDVATPFGQAFNDLLVSHLVRQGADVSMKEEGSLVVDYKVQYISYAGDRSLRTYPGHATAVTTLAATAVGAGIAAASGVVAGAVAGSAATVLGIDALALADSFDDGAAEVIVTTQVTDADQYVMRKTSIYYVPAEDMRQYVARFARKFTSRRYTLVNQ